MARRRRRTKKRPPRVKAQPSSLVVAKDRTTPTSSRAPWFLAAAAVTMLVSGVVDAAPAKKQPSIAPPAAAATPVALKPPPPKRHFVPAKDRPAWGAALPTIAVTNNNTGAKGDFRLYSDRGSLDLEQMKQFMTVVNGEDGPLDNRLVQLAFRAAYHFKGAAITVVSGTRKGAHGKHGSGAALDFKLEGVPASELAKYVRTFPRAGIGIYTHPKTQYVHVDTREHSYHWIDASPPGVTWREQLLADPKREDRDASYTAATDLPETAR